MPLSSTLADAMQVQLEHAERGIFNSPEMRCAQPLLALQSAWSALPTPRRLVAETLHTREGWHLFLYPMAGRLVHQGLAGLLAWRAAQQVPNTFSMAINDYGLELLSAKPIDWPALLPVLLLNRPVEAPMDTTTRALNQSLSGPTPSEKALQQARGIRTEQPVPHESTPDRAQLENEILSSLNATEMARRRFREIARIAGLVFQSHPGEQRSSRQLQASSSLYYDVFAQYDPGNLLLAQARAELLTQELDVDRLSDTLRSMQSQTLCLHALQRPTPFALPLMVERLRERLSTETLADRLARMVQSLEATANETTGQHPVNHSRVAADMAWDTPESATTSTARTPRRSRSTRKT